MILASWRQTMQNEFKENKKDANALPFYSMRSEQSYLSQNFDRFKIKEGMGYSQTKIKVLTR